MEIQHIIILSVLGIAVLALLFTFLISYICYHKTFYSPAKVEKRKRIFVKKASFIFIQNMDTLSEWKEQVRSLPSKDVSITSFDGLKLVGRYYETKKGAPIEILFHGYRGSADLDMDGHLLRVVNSGRNVLAVDQRASGDSEGTSITFGINESNDCLRWTEFVVNNIDKNAKIILTGVSMGAATVLTASALDLPKNVVAIIADCGYTSAKEIIMATMKDMHLSPSFFYPFAIIGGKLFGHFDIDESSPIEAMKNAKVPIIFIHGDRDDFVPYEMGKRNYEACTSQKKFVTFERAGHASSYLLNQKRYSSEIEDFLNPILNN